MTTDKLVALADELQTKYEEETADTERAPATLRSPLNSLPPPSSESLFTLINKNSHLCEKIAHEALLLSDNLVDYEDHASSFSKEKLIKLEQKLSEVLFFLRAMNKI